MPIISVEIMKTDEREMQKKIKKCKNRKEQGEQKL